MIADIEPGSVMLQKGRGASQEDLEVLPPGPASHAATHQWCSQFAGRLEQLSDGKGLNWLSMLLTRLQEGIQINTDYSGTGQPEHVARQVARQAVLRDCAANVVCWRASDIEPHARQALIADGAGGGAQHVFGDLLRRVSSKTRKQLRARYAVAESQVTARAAAGEELKAVQTQEGSAMMKDCLALLDKEPRNLDDTAFCFKCQQRCRHYGPADQDKGMSRMSVAGTTCTPWSRMGSKNRWAAFCTVVFAAWASEVKFWDPDFILHECTEDFDVELLHNIFGSAFVLFTVRFSPVELGIPVSRPRVWTLGFNRARVVCHLPFSRDTFGKFFFRQLLLDGHIYFEATPEDIKLRFLQCLAEKQKLAMDVDGELGVACRELLPEALHQMLLAYEKHCRKKKKPLDFIVNLRQKPSFMQGFSSIVPTLLTHTSILWSMRKNCVLPPLGHLDVMGFPVFVKMEGNERSGLEQLALAGGLSDIEILSLAGNGMVAAAVGSVFMFGLATTTRRAWSLPRPLTGFAEGALGFPSPPDLDSDLRLAAQHQSADSDLPQAESSQEHSELAAARGLKRDRDSGLEI